MSYPLSVDNHVTITDTTEQELEMLTQNDIVVALGTYGASTATGLTQLAVKVDSVATEVTGAKTHTDTLVNTDLTLVNSKVDAVALAVASGSGLSTEERNTLNSIANDVWTSASRTLTETINETDLHTALDTYSNKGNWKADLSYVNNKTNEIDLKVATKKHVFAAAMI